MPPTYIDNLEALRTELNRAGESLPEARKAIENFNNIYAPVWGRGAGAAYEFRQDFNADRSFRTASPPTATAQRFLTTGGGAKEKAEALARIVGSIAEPADRQAALNAVRQYVFSDMTRTVGADGKINPQQLARWLNGPGGWNDALSQFPSLHREVEQLLADVRTGRAARDSMAEHVERAAASLKRTQRDIDNSALSLVIGREPTKAARAVLESRDPQTAMKEIREVIGGNKQARLAWERAVTDHLVDRVTNVDPAAVSTGERSISYGKLVRSFDRYQSALGELYAGQPDKMAALQQVKKMLEPLAKTSGPATLSRPGAGDGDSLWKALEIGLKAHYGILKGGGVLRTLRLAATAGRSAVADSERLVARMMFDPELAQHLLTRDVKEVGGPAWNAKLATLLRRVQAGREVSRDDEAQTARQ
jgi:hypothetical protein